MGGKRGGVPCKCTPLQFWDWDTCEAEGVAVEFFGEGEGARGDEEVYVGYACD
jgi:hypothetical protein